MRQDMLPLLQRDRPRAAASRQAEMNDFRIFFVIFFMRKIKSLFFASRQGHVAQI
jgi:hypothetical protein